MARENLRIRLLRLAHPVESPRPGELTTEKWAKKWNYEASSTRRLIIQGLRAGLMYRKDYRVKVGARTMRVPHYGEVKSPKPATTAKPRR